MSAELRPAFVAAPRPRVGDPGPWEFPATEERSLSNGARIVSCHLPGRDVITARLIIPSPLSAEPHGVEGIATVLAGGLTQGTRRRDREDFTFEVERLGATVRAAASHTSLSMLISAVAGRFGAAFALAMEALTEPALSEADIDRLRATHRDELAQDRANPAQRADLELFSSLYEGGERLARPLQGTAAGLTTMTRDDVVAFHATTVSPARATLLIAGDLRRLDVDGGVAAVLGDWRSSGPGAAPSPGPPRAAAPAVRLVHRAGAAQTEVRLVGPAVTRAHPDWAPLAVGSYALGGSMTSRLMQVLREQRGYTYGVSARCVSLGGGAGFVAVSGAFETSVTGAAVAEALRIIGDLTSMGVTAEESVLAVRNIGAAARRMETSAAVVGLISEPISEGLSRDWCRQHYARLDAVTAAEASATAALHWGAPLSVVAVGDAELVAAQLAAAGLGEAEVVDEG
ncbi:MAG: M16 family metallopeptidase [Candidatus Dormibacteria bacterium]